MAVLKWKNTKEWVALYVDAIKNRLRRDLNLSDLTNKQDARKNIELIGDNNHTHYHDDRYLPAIEKEGLERKASDKEILDAIKRLDDRLESVKRELTSQINSLKDIESSHNSSANSRLDKLEARIATRTSLGNIKVGSTLSCTSDGTLNVMSIPNSNVGGNIWIR
jgi:hypothetical protein